MIRVDRKPLSDEARARYEAKVLGPGLRWIEAHPPPQAKAGEPLPKPERPQDYWREIRDDLADAFHERCAYTAMWLSHPGTVDHFVSIDEVRTKAYDWDNFRYCAGWFNSSKQGLRSSQLLDPLERGGEAASALTRRPQARRRARRQNTPSAPPVNSERRTLSAAPGGRAARPGPRTPRP